MKKFTGVLMLMAILSTSFAMEPDEAGPGDDAATVVFMRSSAVGSMIKASIYEVTDDKTVFIGIMKNNTKISYPASPGKHTFMVVSEAADFMEADLAAGKTYYGMITPRTGAWKARFSMVPIRNGGATDFSIGSKDFEKWVKKTKPVTVDSESEAWYQEHKDSVESKRQDYWAKWLQKSPAELAERTLNPGDGILP